MGSKTSSVDDLRRPIALLDGLAREHVLVPLGVPDLDEALCGGLMRGMLHEITVAQTRDAAAGLGFTLALLARLLAGGQGLAFWTQQKQAGEEAGHLYRSGLLAYGLSPQRLLIAELRRIEDLLWAMEQGAHCRALAGVVAEVWGSPRALTFKATRRLMLAARQSGVTLFLLRLGAAEAQSAAWTRWQVTPAPSIPDLDPRGLGMPCFDVSLTRNRTGGLGRWRLMWDVQACAFRSMSEMTVHDADTTDLSHPVAVAEPPRDRPREEGAPGKAARGRRRG